MSENLLRWTVDKLDADVSLAEFLAARLPSAGMRQARKLIAAGHVRVNGRGGHPDQPLRPGSRVEADAPGDAAPGRELGRTQRLEVVFEDESILVVDKPPATVVLPSRGTEAAVLFESIQDHLKAGTAAGGAAGVGRIVHRLDKDTSGLLVVAKTSAAMRALTGQFEARRVKKTYLAIVEGEVPIEAGLIEFPIAQEGKRPGKMMCRKDGKPAATDFSVTERFQRATVLSVQPRTGRTHQIRVHLAQIRFPLLVDPLYGRRSCVYLSELKPGYKAKRFESERPVMERLTLHAAALEFAHPADGRAMKFESPLPRDLRYLLKVLRKYRSKEVSETVPMGESSGEEE